MSDPTTEPTPPEPTTEPASEPAPEPRDPDAAARSREAAGYRTKLREAETALTERDSEIATLRARLDDHDRLEVERLAGARGMLSPEDLWTVAKLADQRGEDDALNPELVHEHVDALLRERPHWKRPVVDLGAGPRRTDSKSELGLSRLLGKR